MKIAIAGKGGTGKTTLAGTLARAFAQRGYKVLAIDADPAMNLAYSLGIEKDAIAKIVPLYENKELIEERTGIKVDGMFGVAFSLTPKVNDIADKFGIKGPDGVVLLIMGTVKSGGIGCMCPANALLRALLRHLLIERDEIVIMDMEAGLEHLGRGTAKGVDALLIVVEPGIQSIETAVRIKRLGEEIGIPNFIAIGNKIKSLKDEVFLKEELSKANLNLLYSIPYDEKIVEADMLRIAPIDYAKNSKAIEAIKIIGDFLIKLSF
jgi:CO dehydrogenase maturation factor